MANEVPERVVVERVLPASPAEVYEAWTSRETLARFLCPGDMTATVVEVDVRIGGRFVVVMHDGDRHLEHRGEYRVLEPGRRLVFTWASPPTSWQETLVTVELTPQEDGTRLVLIHEGLSTDDVRGRHRRGWTSIVEKLTRYLRKETA
jgi:uncharacterized protein YndB with AHSA1/START domain